jgi:hypothetical protein
METKVRLNNFILWCKGWYESTNEDMDILDEALIALKLDGYEFATKHYVLGIVLTNLDEMIDKGILSNKINLLRFYQLHKNILEIMHLYNYDYNRAFLSTIRSIFMHEITRNNVKLNPPVYSRKLYKMGFVAPANLGNSYKLATYKANKFFKLPLKLL